MKLFIKSFESPRTLISDQKRSFVAKEFKALLEKKNIKQILIYPYNPQSNGLVERRSRIILEVLKIFKLPTIKQYTNVIEKRHNEITTSSTVFTPRKLLLEENELDIISLDDYKNILAKAQQNQMSINRIY